MRPPHRVSPPSNWRHRKVWEAVRNRALPELPLHFRSTIQIGGIHATEIYTFDRVFVLPRHRARVRLLICW